jgi:hypothetical protein
METATSLTFSFSAFPARRSIPRPGRNPLAALKRKDYDMTGRPVVLFLLLAAALAFPAVASARPFEGTVGPGAVISLKRANGTKLKHTTPGVHRFAISDQASFHNFHLFGPGVSKKTGIAFIGSRSWKVTLQVGTYKFRCDAHPKTMRGSFDVS